MIQTCVSHIALCQCSFQLKALRAHFSEETVDSGGFSRRAVIVARFSPNLLIEPNQSGRGLPQAPILKESLTKAAVISDTIHTTTYDDAQVLWPESSETVLRRGCH
jgi:hypothetical protein